MGLKIDQEIITFYAIGDIIGNFRRDNDLGRHIPLSVFGENKDIKFVDMKNIFSKEFASYFYETKLKYHGMADIFKRLNETEDGRRYVIKRIKYVK
jgi:hypothetical protein